MKINYGLSYTAIRALRWLGLMLALLIAMFTDNIDYFIVGLMILLVMEFWETSDLIRLLTKSSVYTLKMLPQKHLKNKVRK